MLVTFKSKSAADVLMYEEHAKRILDILGKDLKQGVITAEETTGAIARLEQEIALSKGKPFGDEKPDDADGKPSGLDDDDHAPTRTVGFATRAYPFLEMLRAAQKNKQAVAWGI